MGRYMTMSLERQAGAGLEKDQVIRMAIAQPAKTMGHETEGPASPATGEARALGLASTGHLAA
jgi:hypothetical protein